MAARGVQSIEVGGQLLQALARAGKPMPLKELAQAADMTPAKAHPYLVSFQRLGLVAQEGDGGRYGLGPMAMELGLISLQQHDPVRLASQALEGLAQSTACTVALAVWGNQGPTVVQVVEAPSPLHVSLRHGTVLNLAQTATGQVLAAHRPRLEVDALWRAQGGSRIKEWHAQLALVSASGHAFSDEGLLPGFAALAVPGIDAQGTAQWALLAVAPRAQWEKPADRAALRALLVEAATRVRRQLGWTSELGA
ncbi:MAG: IclR family transcriptional regulator [Burkholderiales bacterium]|jgi:DNA-binding IclR family transcriptional regulator